MEGGGNERIDLVSFLESDTEHDHSAFINCMKLFAQSIYVTIGDIYNNVVENITRTEYTNLCNFVEGEMIDKQTNSLKTDRVLLNYDLTKNNGNVYWIGHSLNVDIFYCSASLTFDPTISIYDPKNPLERIIIQKISGFSISFIKPTYEKTESTS